MGPARWVRPDEEIPTPLRACRRPLRSVGDNRTHTELVYLRDASELPSWVATATELPRGLRVSPGFYAVEMKLAKSGWLFQSAVPGALSGDIAISRLS